MFKNKLNNLQSGVYLHNFFILFIYLTLFLGVLLMHFDLTRIFVDIVLLVWQDVEGQQPPPGVFLSFHFGFKT